jgi:hypothetical protein
VRFKILTVVLLRIQVFWDSPVVMEVLEFLKLMFLQNAKNHIPMIHCHIPGDLHSYIREDCLA